MKHTDSAYYQKNILYLLHENKDKLDRLLGKYYKDYDKYFNLYDETIRELLNNQNLFSLINKLCYYKISKINLHIIMD